MKTLTILGCLFFAAIILLAASHAAKKHGADFSSLRSLRKAFGLHVGILRINALGDGIHMDGIISQKADAALATRHYLVKVGSDANHVAVIAAASDEPMGVCIDEAEAAEDDVSVKLLGACKGTVLMVANETITAGEDVYSGTDGRVQDLPGTAGTYWKVGRSVTASTADLEIEVEPCLPRKLVVIANGASLATTQGAMTGSNDVKVL
jgi:predicted RecA/RadA family phage recombinase